MVKLADHFCIGQVVYFSHNEVAPIAKALLKAYIAREGSRYAMLLELALFEVVQILFHK